MKKKTKKGGGVAALAAELDAAKASGAPATAEETSPGQGTLGFAGRWFDGLNPEQAEVVRHQDGPCRVLALAGSGKTESLSRRIARMVSEGVDPSRILAVTFSTKAADEMSTRISKKFGVAGARIGTWHSVCLQILRDDNTEQGSWAIEGDKKDSKGTNSKLILKDVVGWKGLDWKGVDVTALAGYIGKCKANLFDPDSEGALRLASQTFSVQATRAVEAFHRYNEELAHRGLLTFDDFLVGVAKHFEDEVARSRWAARWDYVIQDEAQDANRAQCHIAGLLSRDHRNYMVIGDCFQAIYGFRGSSPEFLAKFDEEWGGARTITLPRNYRSGRKIIAAANSIVSRAKLDGLDAPGEMIGERDSDGEVKVLCAESLDDEANEIVGTILRSVSSGESKLSDHTVLYRTNAQSRAVEEALLENRIPYVVVGGVSFYERKEVRDLLAYLRLAAGTAKLDDIKRSINTPFRFLGARFVEKVQDAVERRNLSTVDWAAVVLEVASGERIQDRQRASAAAWAGLVRAARDFIARGAVAEPGSDAYEDARPSKVLDHVVRTTGYIDWLKKEEGEETSENSAAANVREMVRVAERFPTAGELLEYIDETIRSARSQRDDKQAGGERVLLMNIHRSKGLEWPRVYVVGMNEMVLPHAKGDVEEERRLAYVAATRARDYLSLSYVRRIATRVGIRDVGPSRFLVETGLPLDAPSPNGGLGAILGGASAALPEIAPLP